MQAINALKLAFTHYATFQGRASRADYWWYVLAYLVVAIVLGFVDKLVFGGGEMHVSAHGGMSMRYDMGVLASLWALANLLPSLAVAARRLHDTDRTGWMQLLVFIPLLGWLYLLYVLVQKGTAGDNRFGAAPLA